MTFERRVRADCGGGEDLVDAELRASLEADLAVRRGELGGPVHQRHPVLGLTRCEQLVHDGRAARSRRVARPAHLDDRVDVPAGHEEGRRLLRGDVRGLGQQDRERTRRALAGREVGGIADVGDERRLVVHRDGHVGFDRHPVGRCIRLPTTAGPRGRSGVARGARVCRRQSQREHEADRHHEHGPPPPRNRGSHRIPLFVHR